MGDTKQKEDFKYSDCDKIEEEICDTCGGAGTIRTMERVYPDEPHMAPVGESPCPDCQDTEPPDFSGASEGDR